MNQPLFSIVIPTRNRGRLLETALRCALAQRMDDFEIVVSDNDSSDATPDVVRGFDSQRIRYFRTPRTLHMPDSWEFALSHARGRYVTFLSDDDGASPNLLEMIDGALKTSGLDIVAWPFASRYFHPTTDDERQRNTLIFTSLDGRQEVVRASDIISDLSGARFTHKLPRMINSCASAGLLEEVRSKFGRVFLPPCPDFSAGAAQLAVRKELAFVNSGVVIWGISEESIGYSATVGTEAASRYLDELKADNANRTRCVPLQAFTAMNYATDSVFYTATLAGGSLSELTLDPLSYYTVVGTELLALERNGVDVRKDFKEMSEAVRRESPATRLKLARRLALVPGGRRLRDIRRAILARWPALRKVSHREAQTVAPEKVVRGQDAGFSNIYEAALWLSSGAAKSAAAP